MKNSTVDPRNIEGKSNGNERINELGNRRMVEKPTAYSQGEKKLNHSLAHSRMQNKMQHKHKNIRRKEKYILMMLKNFKIILNCFTQLPFNKLTTQICKLYLFKINYVK